MSQNETGIVHVADWVDAQAMSAEHATFEAPSPGELDAVGVGDSVKISDGEDRFWVQVTEIVDDKIRGTVDNQLVNGQPYDLGDTVEFERRHIYDAPDAASLEDASATIKALIDSGLSPEQALKLFYVAQQANF